MEFGLSRGERDEAGAGLLSKAARGRNRPAGGLPGAFRGYFRPNSVCFFFGSAAAITACACFR